MRKSKISLDSQVEMREIVMPHHANPHGLIFGGQVMSWIDMAGAMVAGRHSESIVATVHVDNISFKAPIKVGHHVHILASLNYVGNSSMEVGVKVMSEDPLHQKSEQTTQAYLTFVALDEKGNTKKVPELILETEDDKRRNKEAELRIAKRNS